MNIKIYLLLAYLISITVSSNAQPENEKARLSLLNEIKKEECIEFRYEHRGRKVTKTHLKKDSLFSVSSLSEIISYFYDTAYPLKLYAFRYIVKINDSIAFELLKHEIRDTTYVCNYGGSSKFNHLLVSEYSDFIALRYGWGRSGTFDGQYHYIFSGPNKTLWKKKNKELRTLMKNNKIPFKGIIE